MLFQIRKSHTVPLFKMSQILNSFDKTVLEICIFISKSLKSLLTSVFNNLFEFSFESQPHDTRWSTLGILKYPLTVLNPTVDIQCL